MKEWIVDLKEHDSELWFAEDRFNTREEAIKEGKKLAIKNENEKCFRVGRAVYLEEIPGIDVNSLLEQISAEVYDKVGEVAEDYLMYVDEKQIKELNKELNSVFQKWVKKYKHEPNFYIIEEPEIIYLDK